MQSSLTILTNSGLKFPPSRRFTSLNSASIPSSGLCTTQVSLSRQGQTQCEHEQSELGRSRPDGRREGVEDGLTNNSSMSRCTGKFKSVVSHLGHVYLGKLKNSKMPNSAVMLELGTRRGPFIRSLVRSPPGLAPGYFVLGSNQTGFYLCQIGW